MAMIKQSVLSSQVEVFKMVFVCPDCGQEDIVNEDNYIQGMEKKCSKCEKTMVLGHASNDNINPCKINFTAKATENSEANKGGDYFMSPPKE